MKSRTTKWRVGKAVLKEKESIEKLKGPLTIPPSLKQTKLSFALPKGSKKEMEKQ